MTYVTKAEQRVEGRDWVKNIKGGNLDLIPKIILGVTLVSYKPEQIKPWQQSCWQLDISFSWLLDVVAAIGRISSSKDRYTSIECGNNTSLKETQKQLSLWDTETTLTMRHRNNSHYETQKQLSLWETVHVWSRCHKTLSLCGLYKNPMFTKSIFTKVSACISKTTLSKMQVPICNTSALQILEIYSLQSHVCLASTLIQSVFF